MWRRNKCAKALKRRVSTAAWSSSFNINLRISGAQTPHDQLQHDPCTFSLSCSSSKTITAPSDTATTPHSTNSSTMVRTFKRASKLSLSVHSQTNCYRLVSPNCTSEGPPPADTARNFSAICTWCPRRAPLAPRPNHHSIIGTLVEQASSAPVSPPARVSPCTMA